MGRLGPSESSSRRGGRFTPPDEYGVPLAEVARFSPAQRSATRTETPSSHR